MEAQMEKLLEAFAELQEKANVNACFGAPVTIEDRVVIPVASVAYGFGAGMGQGKESEEGVEEIDSGGGGGGGVNARPLAAIDVTSEGTKVEPVIDEQKVALAGILLSGWAIFWVASALIVIFGQRE